MTSEHARIQREHQAARGKAKSAKIGIVASCALAPLTGGASLYSLIINVPKRSHYKKKERRLAAELERLGVEPLEKRKRDTVIPVCTGIVAAVIGAGIPGLEHIADAGIDAVSSGVDAGLAGIQPDPSMVPDQPLPSHAPDADPASLKEGVMTSLKEHHDAVVAGPATIVHDGLQNMWSHVNLGNPQDLIPGAGPSTDVPSASLSDILHNLGGTPGMHGAASEGLAALAGEHVHHAVDLVEKLGGEVVDGTFVDKEMATIGKNITATLIGEGLNMVLDEGTKKVCDETLGKENGKGKGPLQRERSQRSYLR